jgi:succinyl-diaminopimelate desuccinylase
MAFSPDAEFPIINVEKGLMQFSLSKEKYEPEGGKGPELLNINGGTRVNVVPALCECLLKAQAGPIKELVELFNGDSL